MRIAPRTASLYGAIGWPVNLRGLRFSRVASLRPAADGGAAASGDVVIAGEIRSVARARVAVPRLRFEVRDAAGSTLLRWSETPAAASLAAGRSLLFASQPHHLPAAASTVLVRFEDRPAPEAAPPPAPPTPPGPEAAGQAAAPERLALR